MGEAAGPAGKRMASPARRPRLSRLWHSSLVARLVLSFQALLLLAVLLLGAVAFLQARWALERSAVGRLEVAAALKKDALIQWVGEQRREFELLADLQIVRQCSAELFRHPRSDPNFRVAYDPLASLLRSLVGRKDGWQELVVHSEQGEILVSTDQGQEGRYRILERYFVEGKKGPYVEKVHPSPDTYKPTITFSVPLGPEPAGVMAMHLNLKGLHRTVVERSGLGEQAESYLVDRFRLPVSAEGFGRQGFRRGVRSWGIDQALKRRDGDGLYEDFRGAPVIGVFRWIDAMDVALLIEVPQRVAFAPARRILVLVVALGTVVAALLGLGTFFLARQVAGPILRIADAALQVEQGDLKTRVPVVTEDEVGTLGRTFNRMTEALETEIAERVRAEDEREALIRELEARNAELERFTYTVSHDLKSPLVTIRGFLGLLLQDIEAGDAERVAADVEHIHRATETMHQLLAELLELSRVGQQLVSPEDVALDDLVRQAVESSAGRIAQRGVEVVVEPDLGVVSGDRTRLLEVFQNLVDNAVAFMGDQPAPRVEIGTRSEDDRILCYVRDNGIGIEPQYQDKVFGLFERLDATADGTGIGLALVKRIVELHGGRIRIESPGHGGGTTFLFGLPAAHRRVNA